MAEYYYNLQGKDLGGPSAEDISKNWPWATLSYVGLLFIIPLVLKKDSRFAVYHARQGLVIFILTILLFLVWVALSKLLPQSEYAFLFTTGLALFDFVVIFIISLSGILNTLRGEERPALFLDKIMFWT